MKIRTTILSSALAVLSLSGCISTATPPAPAAADTQQTIANAVEDAISIGLVPVLTKNPDYVAAAQGVANALGSFTGSDITPGDVAAFLARTKLSAEDQRTVAGIVNAAWATYAKRYAQRVNSSVRPDVKIFLAAVANGINAAVAATPKPIAALPGRPDTGARPLFGACGVPAIGRV